MFATRSRLWVIALAALALAAVVFNARSPRRTVQPTLATNLPAPVADSGGGCATEDFPRDLDAWPPDAGPAAEDRQRATARRKVVACIAHKLYPSAAVQFGYTQKGEAAFDLVFADRSYARLSASTFTVLAPAGEDVIYLLFVWPTSDALTPMPPLVVARADADGNISFYRSLAFDPDARLNVEHLPKWGTAREASIDFDFQTLYLKSDSEIQIDWSATTDSAQPKLLRLVPTNIHITRAGKTLRDEKITPGSMIGTSLELNFGGQTNRVACTYAAGEDCVGDTKEVVSLFETVSK